MRRIYLVPKAGTGSAADAFRPKYVADPVWVASRQWSAMDYGLEPVMLASADVTPEEHTALAAQADVVAAPANLENQVGAARDTVVAALEAWNIPGEWVTAGMTFKAVVRNLTKLFAFMQRYHGAIGRLFGAGFTLNDTVGSLPVQVRTNLQTVAATYGVDTSGISGSTPLRSALQQIIVQVPVGTLGGII